jgi:ribosome-interacting GTPase 1
MIWIMTYIFHHTEIFNADIVIREDITVEQFIDVVLGNRRYINCIYVSV